MSAPDGTHYDVLGVAPSAPTQEIRRAYLEAARRHHPDLESDPARRARAEVRMQRVNAAWSVLSDPDRRRRYDVSLGLPDPGSAPHRAWMPIDDGADEDDELELLDDTPYGDGRGLPRALQVVPPILLLTAVGCVLVGSFTAIPGLLGLGVAVGVGGVVLFLAAPFYAVLRGHRAPHGSAGSAGDG